MDGDRAGAMVAAELCQIRARAIETNGIYSEKKYCFWKMKKAVFNKVLIINLILNLC